MRLAAIILPFAAAASTALAQTPATPPATAPPIPIDPQMVIADARSAYTTGPTADEVVITLRDKRDETESERIVVRIEPGAPGEAGPKSLLLELGALRIHARPGRIVAASRDSSAFWAAEFDGWDGGEGGGGITPAKLRSLIPSIPLPQIALACPGSEPSDLAPPFTDSLVWMEALATDATQRDPATAAASGRSTLGLVTLTIDVDSKRLRKVRFVTDSGAALPANSAVTQMDMEIAPIDPGDPAAWVIHEAGLTRVDALADLFQHPAVPTLPPLLAVGDPVPDFTLTDGDTTSWSLHAAARTAGGFNDQGPVPGPVVILLFRSTFDPTADAATESDALAGREAIRLAPPEGATGSGLTPTASIPRFADKAAAITDLAAFTPERFGTLRTRWLRAPRGTDGRPAPAVLLDSDQLFWSPSWHQTMARFSREAKALLAVVGEDLTLRTVIPLDGRAGQTEKIVEDLRSALVPPSSGPP